jgi:predicted aspartyl protease
VKNNTYTDDYADVSGGAIYVNGNGVTFSENKFKNTKASGESGGAITIHGDKNTITNNDFKSTNAKTSGGAVFFEGSNGKINNNNFTSCHSGSSAGALYVTGASATLSNNKFESNTADTIAGAVQFKSDNGALTNNQFTGNAAKGSGGAAYIEGTGITASNNVFSNNKGESNSVGGAFRWTGDKAIVTENRFVGNSATQTGYAVYGEGDNSQITKNTFVNSKENDKTLIWNGNNNKISDNIYGDNRETKLTASDVTMYYGGSSKLVITLTDGQSKAIPKAEIKVSFNNANSTLTTDSNGQVSLALNKLDLGSYKATAKFAGDNNHDASDATATVTVKSTIDAKDLTADYNNAKYNATFLDTSGKALAKGTYVSFAIGNDNYRVQVGNNGVATATIDKTPGKYDIESINPTTGETTKNKLTIKQAATTTTLTGAENATVGDKTTLVATVNAASGNVVFDVNNNKTTVKLTKGKATLDLGALKEGQYTVTASYKDPENNYLASSAKATFAITKKSASLTVKANDITEEEDAVFEISVLQKATGQITLTINKKDYVKNVTNGKATFKISNLTSGKYPYTVKYSGDNIYSADKKNWNFKC